MCWVVFLCTQFSILTPGIVRKSFSLSVTTVNPKCLAVAPMRMSNCPTGLPLRFVANLKCSCQAGISP